MKKIVIPFLILVLMAVCVLAPPSPFIAYGHVEWNTQLLSGARLQLTNVATGYSETTTTDSNGYWQSDAGNFLNYGESLKIKVLDGCGSADVCEKTVVNNGVSAVADFSVTGALAPCPSVVCDCGGGGGGGCSCSYTETKCRDLYPCSTVACPIDSTPYPSCKSCCDAQSCPACPTTECPLLSSYCNEVDDICPEEVKNVCNLMKGEICPTCPEPSTPLGAIIAAVLTFIIGGGAVYFTLGRANKIKVVKKDGKDVVQHQHPSLSGYHSPDTIHRVEPHKKGELVPIYEKSTDGVWRYKG